MDESSIILQLQASIFKLKNRFRILGPYLRPSESGNLSWCPRLFAHKSLAHSCCLLKIGVHYEQPPSQSPQLSPCYLPCVSGYRHWKFSREPPSGIWLLEVGAKDLAQHYQQDPSPNPHARSIESEPTCPNIHKDDSSAWCVLIPDILVCF